ncbi:PRTRC system ThiF family protein [Photobacterium sp. GB-72]|uniref:PRTRC system ThiF family protein n=1 Tax=Photobacterium sp. GB-72 TaxID=2022105 RepID=UPI000D15314B|nr:PRTRC system ThiF family protein [Photobacterium sp. GB-72]PSV28056.1 PRTRC system ThiF family protein [Photobacterium sp. GB-72]
MLTYHANESLIIGKPSIALVGAGGTGSFIFRELIALDNLLRRVGGQGFTLTVFDPSEVREANIGRQAFFEDEVGLNKAKALVTGQHMQGLNLDWKYKSTTFNYYTAQEYEIVITAVDVPKVRYELGQRWSDSTLSKETLWLDVGNDENSGNVILGHLSKRADKDALRLPNCYDLYGEMYNVEHDDKKSCSLQDAILKQNFGVNQMAARLAVQLLTNLFTKGFINNHGAMFNTETMTTTPLNIDPNVWATYGYESI